ncbi:MAG: HD-GYP domain-containing protein [Nitrospinae bacterium]|nr:HD-GYP domain-containing protein [Nitrospinota bacterium]
MIKKALVEQLRVGMFVHDFNCGWLENPFFANQLLISDEDQIQKVVDAGIREVYIDTKKGTDISDAQTADEVKKELHDQLTKIAEGKEGGIAIRMQEELKVAVKLQKEAKKIVTDIMHDARMGKQVEVEAVDKVVENMVDSIFRNQAALTSMSKLKSKDEYTFVHSVNVCVLMISFCKSMSIQREVIKKVGSGALLHDIGKMAVAEAVLNKPAKLTDEEFSQMKNHVVQSKRILLETPGIYPEAIEVASQHHERFDGSGYPEKLKGEEISLFGMMSSIVDVYDAITSDRVYHKGMESAEALRKIFEWSKFHFHPELVQMFIRTVGIYPVGTLVRLESGLLAVVAEPGKDSMLTPVVRAVYNADEGHFIKMKEIDLAKPGTADRILQNEDPAKWHIKPLQYLDLFEVMP